MRAPAWNRPIIINNKASKCFPKTWLNFRKITNFPTHPVHVCALNESHCAENPFHFNTQAERERKRIYRLFRLTIGSNKMGQTEYLGRLKWKRSKHPRYQRTCVHFAFLLFLFYSYLHLLFTPSTVFFHSFVACFFFLSEALFLKKIQRTPRNDSWCISLRYSTTNGCVVPSFLE